MSLDINKLENVQHGSGAHLRAACPACRKIGKDNHRDNLSVWENGAYHCWSYPGDRDHRKRIYELAGEKSGRTKNWTNSFNGNFKKPLGTFGTGKLYSTGKLYPITNRVKKGKKIIIPPIFTNKFKTPVPSVPTEIIEEDFGNLTKQLSESILDHSLNNRLEQRLPFPVKPLRGSCPTCWNRYASAIPIQKGKPCFKCGILN